MSNHTPGPWKVDQEGYLVLGIDPEDLDGWVICRATPDCSANELINDQESLANAKLIASAPEMLELLKQIANNCHVMDDLTYCSMAEDLLTKMEAK